MATKNKTSTAKTATKKAVKKTTAKATAATVKTVTAKETETFSNAFTKPGFLAALTAEFIGTFLLASGIVAGQGQPIILIFLLIGLVLIIGNISGAHANPLITVGAWATRRISTVRAVGYIAAQVLGAMLAFVVLNAFVAQAPEVSAEMQAYGYAPASLFTVPALPEGKEIAIMFAELLGALIFAFSVASVTSERRKNSPIAVATGVGGGLFAASLIAGSAASTVSAAAIINPAAAITLQAFTVEGTNLTWAIAIYIGAALIGGVLGYVLSSIVEKAQTK